MGPVMETKTWMLQPLAGWGVVVVVGDSGLGRGSGDVVTEFTGPSDSTSPDAEPEFHRSGSWIQQYRRTLRPLLLPSARLLTEEQERPCHESVADSQYAGNIAARSMAGESQTESLPPVYKHVWTEVGSSARYLHWDHVRAHRAASME
jgi:hypothetical protein